MEDQEVIEPDGTRKWYRNGKLHRGGDQPAIVSPVGSQYWYRNGELHRDGDQPAVVETWGRCWFKYGNLQREGDQPAIVSRNGTQEWYRNHKLHRDDDQPAIIGAYERRWYRDGEKHRDNGQPAVIYLDADEDDEDDEHNVPDWAKHDRAEWWFENYRITESYALKIAERIKQRKIRINWLIRDRIISRLYDPSTSVGHRRMMQNYDEYIELLSNK